jgi:hypothetical protein
MTDKQPQETKQEEALYAVLNRGRVYSFLGEPRMDFFFLQPVKVTDDTADYLDEHATDVVTVGNEEDGVSETRAKFEFFTSLKAANDFCAQRLRKLKLRPEDFMGVETEESDAPAKGTARARARSDTGKTAARARPRGRARAR